MILYIPKYQEGNSLKDTYNAFKNWLSPPAVEEQVPDLYDSVLEDVKTKKGGTTEDYEDLMNSIAFHESKYLVVNDSTGKKEYKYLDFTANQVGGGPGAGGFMFEKGKNQGGYTALKRTMNYLEKNKMEVPQWMKDAEKLKELDASKLTEKQQKLLFLGNYMEHPKADLGKVIKKEESIVDFWGKYHQTQNDPVKKDNFLKDLAKYKSIKKLKKGGKILYKI